MPLHIISDGFDLVKAIITITGISESSLTCCWTTPGGNISRPAKHDAHWILFQENHMAENTMAWLETDTEMDFGIHRHTTKVDVTHVPALDLATKQGTTAWSVPEFEDPNMHNVGRAIGQGTPFGNGNKVDRWEERTYCRSSRNDWYFESILV